MGWRNGLNRTYRLYTARRLQLRSKLSKRRRMVEQRHQRIRPRAADHARTMDFVADQLASGIRFRALPVVDVSAREALAIEVGQPTDSGYVESFNGSPRGECVNVLWFEPLRQAKECAAMMLGN